MPRPKIVPVILDPSYLGNMSVLTGKAELRVSPSRNDLLRRTSQEASGPRLGEDHSARNGHAHEGDVSLTVASIGPTLSGPGGAGAGAGSTGAAAPMGRHGSGVAQLAHLAVNGSPFQRMSMLMHSSVAERNSGEDALPGGAAQSEQQQRLHLYQVLPPVLAVRGPALGSKLRLAGEEWEVLDPPYFDAPGE